MNSVMIGLIPMAGTMTSFGAIKSAIQMTKNCTDDPEPSNVLNVTAGNIFIQSLYPAMNLLALANN